MDNLDLLDNEDIRLKDEDDLESFDEYTDYFNIDDISEDDNGEPKELYFE